MMERILGVLLLAGTSVADSSVMPEHLEMPARPVVKISLPRVLEVLGQIAEAERQEEVAGAILLYTVDDRLNGLMLRLQQAIKHYEQREYVRVDIVSFEEDTPDYTEDFLEKIEAGEVSNDL